MDSNTSVLQIGSGQRAFNGFHFLTRLVREELEHNNDRLTDLWEKVRAQEYAFDDFGRGKLEWFLYTLADPNNEFFMIGDAGIFMVQHPVSRGTAGIHFIIWDRNFSLHREKQYAWELLDYLFYDVGVHRVEGMMPVYNKLAPRFAISMGMKFEGELQEAVLWKNAYHNVQVYGMLERHYRERRNRLEIQ